MRFMRDFVLVSVASVFVLPFVLYSISVVGAQVRESTNYQIQSDSLNFGGGYSSSSNYQLESTGGEVATGPSESTTYRLRAGYQQMQETFISITGASAVVMSPSIPGVSGGTANGSTTVTVTTDSPSGYSLSIQASQSPAMQKSGDTIADYNTSGGADQTFVVGSADAFLGFTPDGTDVVQRFLWNGTPDSCGGGSISSPIICWDGLSTSEQIISQASGSNHPNGATTTINFRVGIGSSVVQAPGTYTATTTLTALPL